MFKRWMAGLVCAAGAIVIPRASTPVAAADDVVQRSEAVYSALHSYADTGTVVEEYGVSSKDTHKFATFFSRAPRRFLFDFHKQGGDRFVVWGDPDAFHTWWKTTGVQEDYPNPNNAAAFSQIGPHSYGAGLKAPVLLFAKAALQGDFTNFADATSDGTDTIDGRPCYRIAGTARDIYQATLKEVNVRKMTLWIDTQSLLIRKVVEQFKAPPGQIHRVTTTYAPAANPTLDDARFRFAPPASGHE
jgi:outer membrane lipoprotein-sorting protein